MFRRRLSLKQKHVPYVRRCLGPESGLVIQHVSRLWIAQNSNSEIHGFLAQNAAEITYVPITDPVNDVIFGRVVSNFRVLSAQDSHPNLR
jgi:hypothetical protein